MGVEGSELDHYLDVCTQMRVRREHFSLPQQDNTKSFKYALYTLSDLTIPAFPWTLASPAFFQPSNLPSSFPASGPCRSHSLCLEHFLPGSLLTWPFSVKLLLTCHFHREGFPDCPLPTLTWHTHHNLLSEIRFLLNYSCVNFMCLLIKLGKVPTELHNSSGLTFLVHTASSPWWLLFEWMSKWINEK